MTFSHIPRNPDTKTLRLFALLCVVLLGGTGLARLMSDGPTLLSRILIMAGFGVGLTGLIFPRAVRAVFVGALIATYPIGWVMSRVLLATVYYGLVSPIALLFRVIRRDRLHLRNSAAPTYWTPIEAGSDADYLRQY